MSFLPQLFLSNIKAKDGLARPNRFQVILPIPQYISKFVENGLLEKILNLPNSVFSDVTARVLGDSNGRSYNPSISRYLALQCETAELPGKSLNTETVQIYGPTFEIPYQAAYTETPLTFLCTNEFYERKLFDKWLEAMVPTDTNNVRFSKGENTFLTNIKIIQYDDFIKQIYAVELIDAFPKSIAAQPLSWADDGFHRLTIQFSYKRYRTIYEGGYDLGAATAALLGSSVSGVPVKDILAGQIKGTAAAAIEAVKRPFSIF
jgi:hypothetical protein